MNKRIMALMAVLCLSSLFFISQLFANGTWNKRETIEHNPISFDTKSGDTPYKVEVKDGIGEAGVRRLMIQHDGVISTHNTSGATVGGIGLNGKPILSWKDSYLVVDTEAEAEAASTAYNTYFVDTVGYAGHTSGIAGIAGVSLYFPVGTAALDGFALKVMNISESGTTDILLVPTDDAVFGSGVTDGIWTDQTVIAGGVTRAGSGALVPAYVYDVNDVKGEMIEFTYVWATGGGTWYQTDRK